MYVQIYREQCNNNSHYLYHDRSSTDENIGAIIERLDSDVQEKTMENNSTSTASPDPEGADKKLLDDEVSHIIALDCGLIICLPIVYVVTDSLLIAVFIIGKIGYSVLINTNILLG